MDLLDQPAAQALLDGAVLSAAAVRACAGAIEAFLWRYLPRFYRQEHRDHARTILRGKLRGLQRKTTEPIAAQAGQERRPLQLFVGAGGWDDQAILGELRAHAREELGHADAVWILDGSGFPKKGADSCGVARQWCGRLGKVDNCQVGIFLAYAAPRGCALLDARLYLPQDWAANPQRRQRCHVPAAVRFQESWRIALDLLDGGRQELPGQWVVGDDEFGRCTELRAALRLRRRRYVLDVPGNTLVRDVSERRPASRPGASHGCRSSSAWTSGWRASRRGGGGRSRCGTGRRGRGRSRCCWRRCRPKTRAAGRGPPSDSWSSAAGARRRRRGIR